MISDSFPNGPCSIGFVGPKIATVGVPIAAAMCIGPESFVITIEQRFRIAASSCKDVGGIIIDL